MNTTRMAFLFCLMATLSAFGSEIKRDEVVVFYPTLGQRVGKGAEWELEIHGCVAEPEKRGALLVAFRAAIELKTELSEAEETVFNERAREFLVDHESGKKIAIRLGAKIYPVGKTAANGRVVGRVRVPAGEVEQLRRGTNTLTFSVVLPENDHRSFTGEVYLLEDTGTSVISDIDDTIKITEVNDHSELLANTFLRPFAPVDGMAAVYREWAGKGVQFHYVSASPWQLFGPLTEFMYGSGLPTGTVHLKEFRVKDGSFVKLFEGPDKYKLATIEPILRRFPQRRFVLVGDSGERDPEVYGTLARKFPKQIVRILIRDVTNEPATAARYRSAFHGVPEERCVVFHDPAVDIGGRGESLER
jgi:phosphatidate phosphatase APP1